ncbi:MAG TPA: hypothetical protein VG916_04315, partial [Gemmatimonadaceae bacterium]|nr:hypothetical protein [Gemmatimonadaceae bacterium]
MLATSLSAIACVWAIQHVQRAASAPALDAALSLYRLASVAAPVTVAIKGASLAAIVWAIMGTFDHPIPYRTCIAAAWAAEPVLAMPTLCFAAAAFARGATTPGDMYVPLGIDLIWQPGSTALALLSHSANIFTLAWPGLMWLLLRRHVGVGFRRWCMVLAIGVPAVLLVLMPVLQFTS